MTGEEDYGIDIMEVILLIVTGNIQLDVKTDYLQRVLEVFVPLTSLNVTFRGLNKCTGCSIRDLVLKDVYRPNESRISCFECRFNDLQV